MITLITAVPGSGKTLLCIGLIESALKEGRPVFTNISGLVKEKFTNYQLLQDAPNDWRDTPQGSLVIYDEAQQSHLYPSNAQRGKVDDERLTAMETHRHTGHDLIFVTQAPTFVHHHIRKLVGQHIHLYRARGVTGAMKYEWSHTCESPNDRGEQVRADSEIWRFNKDHYPFYTSAVIHTHKFRIPKKIMYMGGFILFLLGISLYFASSAFSDLSASENPVVNQSIASQPSEYRGGDILPTTYSWSSTPEAIPVSGCIANKTKCMCFSDTGITLDIEHGACLSIIDSPFPRNIISKAKKDS